MFQAMLYCHRGTRLLSTKTVTVRPRLSLEPTVLRCSTPRRACPAQGRQRLQPALHPELPTSLMEVARPTTTALSYRWAAGHLPQWPRQQPQPRHSSSPPRLASLGESHLCGDVGMTYLCKTVKVTGG